MGTIFFVIKAAVLTVIVVMLLQVKIGPTTVEQKSHQFLRESAAIDVLRGVADGAVSFGAKAYFWAKGFVNKQLGSSSDAKARRSDWESEVTKSSGDETD